MLVSHRYRFIYTKTFKTASTSVEAYFERFCMPEGEWAPSHGRDEYVSATGIIGCREASRHSASCRWYNHMPAARIRAALGETIWNSYHKFCVIRNPFEKCISAFEQLGASHTVSQAKAWLAAVRWGMTPEQARFYDFLTRRKVVDRDVYTIDGTFCMDTIIRYESLHDDLQRVCEQLSVPYEPGRLPTYKAGTRRADATAERLYTPRARAVVERRYAFELERFGYQFPASEPLSRRAA